MAQVFNGNIAGEGPLFDEVTELIQKNHNAIWAGEKPTTLKMETLSRGDIHMQVNGIILAGTDGLRVVGTAEDGTEMYFTFFPQHADHRNSLRVVLGREFNVWASGLPPRR